MTDYNTAADNGNDRRIDSDRLTRALTQEFEIAPTHPLQFAVTHDDREHGVDVEAGSCTCEDHQYRGESVVCKHQCAAAVYGIFTDGVRTRLQARVLSATRELGCPHGSTSITDDHDCEGPLGRGVFPCPQCVEATPGDWSAWNFLTNGEHVEPDTGPDPDAGAGEQAVATDGGQLTGEKSDALRECRLCGTRLRDDSERTAASELCFICDARCERNHPWTPPENVYRDKSKSTGVEDL